MFQQTSLYLDVVHKFVQTFSSYPDVVVDGAQKVVYMGERYFVITQIYPLRVWIRGSRCGGHIVEEEGEVVACQCSDT